MAPIHNAAGVGDVETLRVLLAEGVSPDAIDIDDNARYMPLHTLLSSTLNIKSERVACFKLLREAGARLEATDRYGCSPLHHAAAGGDAKIVSILVEAGANVNALSSIGTTALHSAAMGSGCADCVKILLAAGAAADEINNDGWTPLELARLRGERRLLPLFLRAGAEIPTNTKDPYLIRVKNAGGFKKYEQAHLARITAILETPLLPPELVRKVLEFWLHAGEY